MTTKQCTLVFLRRGGEILLAMKKRGFGQGHWNGAGGKIEPGETIEQAMIREAEEEIGVRPTRFRRVAVQHFRTVEGERPWANITHTFLCDEWRGQPHETDEMAPRWFRLADIPYEQMWDDDFLWLPLILKGKLLRTEFTFDADDRMLSAHINIVQNLQP